VCVADEYVETVLYCKKARLINTGHGLEVVFAVLESSCVPRSGSLPSNPTKQCVRLFRANDE
jgi:hypothetical protein